MHVPKTGVILNLDADTNQLAVMITTNVLLIDATQRKDVITNVEFVTMEKLAPLIDATQREDVSTDAKTVLTKTLVPSIGVMLEQEDVDIKQRVVKMEMLVLLILVILKKDVLLLN
jgi:hypothetical protein